MRLSTTTRLLLASAALGALAACGGSRPAARPGGEDSPALLTPAPAPRSLAGWVGDTASFKSRITGVGYAPDRVSYETSKPAYVTIVGVNESSIVAIMPLVGEAPQIVVAGSHTTGLNESGRGANRVANRFGPRAGSTIPDEDARLAEIQAYNRCVERAEAADKARRAARPVVIGRDSAGRPIYGPAPAVAGEYTATSQCRMGLAGGNDGRAPIGLPAARAAGRYFFIYLSDTPVKYDDIAALAITETEPQLMAISIGRKLFGPRGAVWSGQYRSW